VSVAALPLFLSLLDKMFNRPSILADGGCNVRQLCTPFVERCDGTHKPVVQLAFLAGNSTTLHRRKPRFDCDALSRKIEYEKAAKQLRTREDFLTLLI
jgi:hypothetical protein